MPRTSQPENHQTGFIMVKPHAFDTVLDPVVREILDGEGLAAQLAADDELRPVLSRMTVGNPVIRNLTSLAYGDTFLDLLYHDKSTRRYFPLIKEYYMGKIAIIPYFYNGVAGDMPRVYAALKGTTETYDADGNQLDKPTGIRGLLGDAYQFHSNESSLMMDDDTYRALFTPVINNFIHVSDSPVEIKAGLRLIYTSEQWAAAENHMQHDWLARVG